LENEISRPKYKIITFVCFSKSLQTFVVMMPLHNASLILELFPICMDKNP